ncbi:MAG: CpaF family protein [Bdellovibrionales bacterium]
MSTDLQREAHRILEAFAGTWTLDIDDLTKPSGEQVMRNLIQQSPGSLQERLKEEFFGWGPLTAQFNDNEVQEIVINGADEIWIERQGAFAQLADRFLTPLTFKNFVDRLCSAAAIRIDLAQPFVDGSWESFRIHVGCAPLTHCEFHVTLRRRPNQPWTLDRLESLKWADPGQMQTLRQLIHERRNVIFVGPTGCGKTSVLGACLKELPGHERVIVIEDTDELPRPNSASTKLLTRSQAAASLPDISLADLVKQSLRMRPFRLVMGEVRGAEAKDLLLALATGHSGSLGTLHASDARQALLRLEMLVQLGAPQWNVQAIRQLLQLSVDALVVCGLKEGHRSLEGIFKVAALESFGFLLEPMT